jgi:membrane protease YdiL (CAAX protease family)
VTDWTAFAGIAITILGLLLVLAHLSARGIDVPRLTPSDHRWLNTLESDADHLDVGMARRPSESTPAGYEGYSTVILVANVALSQGVFALLLLGGAFLTQVPASALGISGSPIDLEMLGIGILAGVVLSAANTAAGVLASWAGYDPSADLRSLLTPDSFRGWLLLLGIGLPIVAGFEELLFRSVLVGAFAAGFGISPWVLAIFSSVAFALGHGAQGPIGIVVTGTLGFLLAALFVLTGSLLVVIVAHYLVNALEFIGHELTSPQTT